MKILISKNVQKWRKTNKNAAILDIIEKFLVRVHYANDIKEISPRPKSTGSALRKIPGVVDEFTLNRKYRIYSKCVELKPGVVSFCVATIGSQGNTNMNDDILKALDIFDNPTSEEWAVWKPSTDQKNAFFAQEVKDSKPTASNGNSDIPKQKKNVRKGKPVDENGMTAAERKSARLAKQQQEKQQRKQRKSKKDEQADKAAAPSNAVTYNTTLNGNQVAPQPPLNDANFQTFTDAQYELEKIEHQMNLKNLQIQIVNLKIEKAQHEADLEQLAIKKLQLLQQQKTQCM